MAVSRIFRTFDQAVAHAASCFSKFSFVMLAWIGNASYPNLVPAMFLNDIAGVLSVNAEKESL